MKQKLIRQVLQGMLPYLNNSQCAHLQRVLEFELAMVEISKEQNAEIDVENHNIKLIGQFIAAKRVEGCSEKSLRYYRTTIEAMLDKIPKRIQEIETDDLRIYLTEYQLRKNSSRVTIDNIRRI